MKENKPEWVCSFCNKENCIEHKYIADCVWGDGETKSESELRKEWENYLTMEVFYGDLNQAKRKDCQMFADWWLSQRQKDRERLVSEIVSIEIKSESEDYELAQLRYREKVIDVIKNQYE